MTHNLKPYSTYKPSGVAWLGDVPAHWEVRRLKWVASLNPRKLEAKAMLSPDTPVAFLPMECVGTDGDIAEESLPASAVWNGFTYFRRHDVLVAKITPCFENGKGACLDSLSTEIGFGSTEFHVLRAKSCILPQVLYHMTTLIEFRRLGTNAMTGAAGQQRVPQEFISNYPIALPPLPEQHRIATFLNQKTAEIDEAISKKQRLIDLLKEQKAILIDQAVTKGLNPNVPMRDSGVEWIGEVPAHWEVRRAKYIFREVDERSKTGAEELLSVSHMTGVTPRSEKIVYMFMAEDYAGSKLCRKGDLVINIMWAWMGALGVSDRAGIVSPSYGIFRQQEKEVFNTWYLEHLLRSVEYVAEYNRRSTGLRSSRLRLYADMFLAMKLSIPSKEEQDHIESITTKRTNEIDKTVDAVEREINALNELKSIMISQAVTGKIKV